MSCNVLALLSRSIYMEFEKDVEVKGIPAYRFTPPRSVLASKEENPANEGFCVSRQECLGTGLLKVSPCRKGKRQLVQHIFLPTRCTFTWPHQSTTFCVYNSFIFSPISFISCTYIYPLSFLVNTLL